MTTGELVSLLSHWHDDPDQNERGLTRLWGELSRKGTQGVALYRGHHSDLAYRALPDHEGMIEQSSLMSGVRQWMKSERNLQSTD